MNRLKFISNTAKKQFGTAKNELDKLEKPIQMTKEQYDSQKLKEIDQVLNLDTYQYEIKENEKRINSEFLKVIGKQEKQNDIMKIFRTISNKLKEKQAFWLPFLKDSNKEYSKLKMEAKPNIAKYPVSSIQNSEYNYLVNSSYDDNIIQAFLDSELQYANLHFSKNGNAGARATQAWFKDFKDFYYIYPFYSDSCSFKLTWSPLMSIRREAFHNMETLINPPEKQTSTVLDVIQILEYLLGFKDDFSYFMCRVLKNNSISEENIEFVSISPGEKMIGLCFSIEDKYVTIIKDIENDSFANFYFNSKLDLFTFRSTISGDLEVIFKQEGLEEIRCVKLDSSLFVKPKPIPSIIQSITKFMRENQDELSINSITDIINTSKILFNADSHLKNDIVSFGRNHFLKVEDIVTGQFNLYHLKDNEFVHLAVN